ncbi:MAG: hypothetical protein RR956_03340 [Christensenella sp.]
MKKVISILAFILVLSISVCAYAAPYTNQQAQYSIELPTGKGIYFYTSDHSNMPADLLAVAQKKTPPIDYMVTFYENEQILAYSIDISTVSLSAALPNESAIEASDISKLNAEQTEALSADIKAKYGTGYTFDADTTETLAGKTAITFIGHHTQPNGYVVKLYILVDNNQLFTITTLYREDTANTYQDQVTAILNTLQFSSTPVSGTTTAVPTNSAAPSPSVVSSDPEIKPAENGFIGFIQGIGMRLSDTYHNDPYFPLYVIGICVIVALIIIIIALLRSRHHKIKTDNADITSTTDYYEDIEQQALSHYIVNPSAEESPETSEYKLQEDTDYDLSKYTAATSGYDANTPDKEQPDTNYAARPTIAEEAYLKRSALNPESSAEDIHAADSAESNNSVVSGKSARTTVGSRVELRRRKK